MRENQEKAQDKRAELDAIIAKRAEEAKEIRERKNMFRNEYRSKTNER